MIRGVLAFVLSVAALPALADVASVERRVAAIEIWRGVLPRVDTGAYAAWLDGRTPVAIVEKRGDGSEVDYHFDGAQLIRYRVRGARTGVLHFENGRALAGDGSAALREGEAARARVLGLQAATPYTPASAPASTQAAPTQMAAAGPATGVYGRPAGTASGEWTAALADLLPAMTKCLSWPPTHLPRVLRAWPVDGDKIAVRLLSGSGGRVDCIAARDGQRVYTFAALGPDTPALPDEGRPMFTPAEGLPPAAACLADERVQVNGAFAGWLSRPRC